MSKKIIVITGASSGFGRLSADALAKAGHTVYASMRDTTGRNAPQVAAVKKFARDNNVDLRPIEFDVSSESSIKNAICQIVAEHGRLDVLIHNDVGHMVSGLAGAFTPEQFAELYDIKVLSTQRVNRAALPQMRKQRQGLLVWMSSSSSAGGTPPLSRAALRFQGGHGRAGRTVCPRTGALGGSKLQSSYPPRSLAVPATSHIPARRPTRSALPSTKRDRTRATVIKSRKPLPPSFSRMPMRLRLLKRSSASLTRRSGNASSASTSIRCRMSRRRVCSRRQGAHRDAISRRARRITDHGQELSRAA